MNFIIFYQSNIDLIKTYSINHGLWKKNRLDEDLINFLLGWISDGYAIDWKRLFF